MVVEKTVVNLESHAENAGLSLKTCFLSHLKNPQEFWHPGWLEVISENFLGDRGRRLRTLKDMAERYPVVFHGVGLNIASPEPLDGDYLAKLRELDREIGAQRISDHLCWCAGGGAHFHNLNPLPYTEETFHHIKSKVFQVQDTIERPLVLENLSAYLAHTESEMSENDFLERLCRETGCRRLVDVNNLQVQAENFGDDPFETLDNIDPEHIAEYHLAGFVRKEKYTVDTHSHEVYPEVWKIFEYAYKRAPRPYCLEWDSDIPSYEKIVAELQSAQSIAENSS